MTLEHERRETRRIEEGDPLTVDREEPELFQLAQCSVERAPVGAKPGRQFPLGPVDGDHGSGFD